MYHILKRDIGHANDAYTTNYDLLTTIYKLHATGSTGAWYMVGGMRYPVKHPVFDKVKHRVFYFVLKAYSLQLTAVPVTFSEL